MYLIFSVDPSVANIGTALVKRNDLLQPTKGYEVVEYRTLHTNPEDNLDKRLNEIVTSIWTKLALTRPDVILLETLNIKAKRPTNWQDMMLYSAAWGAIYTTLHRYIGGGRGELHFIPLPHGGAGYKKGMRKKIIRQRLQEDYGIEAKTSDEAEALMWAIEWQKGSFNWIPQDMKIVRKPKLLKQE